MNKMTDEGICPNCQTELEFITTGDIGHGFKQYWYCHTCGFEQ